MTQPSAPQIFWTNLDDSVGDLAAGSGSLSHDETIHIGRFKTPLLRARALGARVFMRSLLARAVQQSPHDLHISTNSYGKPQISGGPYFNLSHSGPLVVMAIHHTCPVGIDVEKAERHINAEVLNDVLSLQERNSLSRKAINNDDRLRLWVRKEATAKALGLGLYIDLTTLDVGFSEHALQIWRKIPTTLDSSPILQLVDFVLPTGDPVAVALASSSEVTERIQITHCNTRTLLGIDTPPSGSRLHL